MDLRTRLVSLNCLGINLRLRTLTLLWVVLLIVGECSQIKSNPMNTEQKVVLTDNELIAEFMGAIKKRDVHEGLPCMLISGGGAPVSDPSQVGHNAHISPSSKIASAKEKEQDPDSATLDENSSLVPAQDSLVASHS